MAGHFSCEILKWPIGAVFNSKCLKSKSMSTQSHRLASQISVALPAVYLSRQDGTIYRPSKYLRMSDKLKNEASVKPDRLTFGYISCMLVYSSG